MTFHVDKPAGGDDITAALATALPATLKHLKDAISQEHEWSDTTASTSVHSEGGGKCFVNSWASRQTSGWAKGRLFYCTDHDKLYYDDGTEWLELDLGGSLLALSGGTMSGVIAMGANKITGLGAPAAGTDGCTKSYADSIVGAGGLHAASHTDGTDDIQGATDSQKGVMTAADHILTTQYWKRAFLFGGM